MKKNLLLIMCCISILSMLVSCDIEPVTSEIPIMTNTPEGTAELQMTPLYNEITQEKAKEMIDTLENYIIVDVRSEMEYDMGHIPGAILIWENDISSKASSFLPDKDAVILVYSNSSESSKIAAQTLGSLGYTKVYEFGSITEWEYEITR